MLQSKPFDGLEIVPLNAKKEGLLPVKYRQAA